MRYFLFALVVAFILPTSAFAAHSALTKTASFSAAQSLTAASSSPGNAYVAGASVVLTAPVAGDLAAIAGSLVTAAPVGGDDLLLGGSISSRASVGGDVRAAGGSITVAGPVAGDLFAVGFTVQDNGRVGGSVFIIGANTTLANGAAGPVTLYANNVSLSGVFAGDVHISAIGHIALTPGTVIRGKLVYDAPERAVIPATASVLGDVVYTNTSYLPDTNASQVLAFASLGFFIIVRIIGALLLAGLLAGLFPIFAEGLAEEIALMRTRSIFLTTLLGFAIVVATPIVIGVLSLTFVGIGLAFLLLTLYILFVMLAFLYAGITVGALLTRRFMHREQILWHDGVLGMTLVSIIGLMPMIGGWVLALLVFFVLGVLLRFFFVFAFSHDDRVR